MMFNAPLRAEEGAGGADGGGSDKNAELAAQVTALAAQLEELKKAHSVPDNPPSDADKLRAELEAKKQKEAAVARLQEAIKFNLGVADFVSANKDYLGKLAEGLVRTVNEKQFSDEERKAAATKSNPTFKNVVIKALKAVSLTDGVSSELLQDSVVSFVGILVDQMTYAIAQLIDNVVLNGIAGDTANFKGVLNASTGVQAVALAKGKALKDVDYDSVADLVGLLKPGDLARAKFCLSSYALTVLRKVKSTDGVPLFANAVAGDPSTFLGKPYFLSEFAPGATDATTAAKNVIAFGDWKKYYIGLMPNTLAIEADPYSNFDKDTIRYRMKMRVGGNPVRTSAFAVLKSGEAAS